MKDYKKFITFSFDDGVTQDKRLAALLESYGLKATFNINSALLGLKGTLKHNGKLTNHTKINPDEVKAVYAAHEVAVHTLTHPNLTEESEKAIIYQVEEDRKRLTDLVGYEVRGMAYPCGGVNNDDRVAGIIKANTGVKYARTITSTYSFDLPQNLYRLNPTIGIQEPDTMFALAEKFLASTPDESQLFYIWGHAYEHEMLEQIPWEKFEKFCQLIANKEDVFYGTNTEVLTALKLI